ncbi:unnamed protein product [Symbiodinium sp. CCMP2592]|nr:unnamed protein product [Symbiodinium sp. CCMP2592]
MSQAATSQSCLHLVEHTSLLQQLSKKGRWQQAWDAQTHLPTRRIHGDQMSCTSLLKSLRHPGRWDLALSFCSKLGHTAVRVNQFVFNALISTCTYLNAWQFGLAALICMGVLRICRDTISYNTVVAACATRQLHAWQAALGLLNKGNFAKRDTISQSAAMAGCASNSLWLCALVLQHETVDSGIETNAILWNTYLNALEGSGEWGILLEALRGMQCISLKPSPTSLTPVVNTVGSLSSWDRAIFMRATSGLYDLILLNSAMCAYGAGHQWKPAQSCLEAMREMRCYDKASLSAAITSCEKASEWRFGLQLVRELSVADSVGFGAAMSVAEKAGHWLIAVNLLRDLRLQQVDADEIHTSACISACERAEAQKDSRSD